MPFLKNGGLFLPVSKKGQPHVKYKIQDSVCLLLQLLDDSQRYLCITKIVWITPAKITADRAEGIGLHFDKSDSGLRALIDSKLSAYKNRASQSQTL